MADYVSWTETRTVTRDVWMLRLPTNTTEIMKVIADIDRKHSRTEGYVFDNFVTVEGDSNEIRFVVTTDE